MSVPEYCNEVRKRIRETFTNVGRTLERST